MNVQSRYPQRVNANLDCLFWETLRAQDDPPRPKTPQDVLTVWQIVRALQPDVESVCAVALYTRESGLDLGLIHNFVARLSPGATSPPPPRRPQLLSLAQEASGAGKMAWGAHDLPRAEQHLRWSLRLWQLMEEHAGERQALVALGQVCQEQRKLREAGECYLAAYELDLASGSRFNQGTELGLLAEVARQGGRYDEAGKVARQALTIHREYGNRHSAAGVYITLGLSHKERAHPLRAWWYLRRARGAARAKNRFSKPHT